LTGRDRKLTLDDIPQEPQIRRSMFDYVARALGNLGWSIDQGGGQSADGADPDAFIPFRRFAELLEDAARETGDPCLGLRIGLSTHPRETGALGFVLVNSPTFGAAIDNLGRYLSFHQTGAEISARHDDGYWRIAYRLLHPALAGFHQDAECTIGMLIAGMTSLSELGLPKFEAHFRRSAGPHTDAFHEALPGVTIRFDQPLDAVLIPSEVAERPVAGADEDLLHILEQHAELLLEQAPGDDEVHSRVEQAVERSLRGGPPRLADVARRLGMGERTLQRRLRERDLTFHDVVDQVRERLARQSVAGGDVTLTEVAFLLGYSESSAFVRAFRRWTGETPLTYRKRAQASS
jgi:AraC-like DNA-binding protein